MGNWVDIINIRCHADCLRPCRCYVMVASAVRLVPNFSLTTKMDGVLRSFTINVCRRTVVTIRDVLCSLEDLKRLSKCMYCVINHH